MGSKKRIAKYILPIMLKHRIEGQWWVEPFCGGCNSLDKITNPRMGGDENRYLIALLKEMQTQVPFTPPHIGEKEYQAIRKNKALYPDWLVGYAGFNLSFAAKFFDGYVRDGVGVRNYENEAKRNLLAQQNLLAGVKFYCSNYQTLAIPDRSIIYCDPPYLGATQYKGRKDKFDHHAFYSWCRRMKANGHTVFVSEYSMPDDFACVWWKEINSNLDVSSTGRKKIEKLFELK